MRYAFIEQALSGYPVGRACEALAKQQKAEGVAQLWSPTFYARRENTAALALKEILPMMSVGAAETAGLFSYGADLLDLWKRAAFYIEHIVKGTKPEDLPVEQVMRLKLVTNMKTHKDEDA